MSIFTSTNISSKLGSTNIKNALSKDDWENIEAGAERMGRALVGSLKSILGEVQTVLEKNVQRRGLPEQHGSQVAGDNSFSFDKRKVNYDDFVARMRDRRAWELRNEVQKFCKRILQGAKLSREELRITFQEELDGFEAMMLQHPLWMGLSEDEQDGALESLERYLTSRLHPRIFAPDAESRQRDAQLRMRIARLHFISPDHLDIAPSNRNAEAWTAAIGALTAMSHKITPLEKLDCILEASQLIYAAPALNDCTGAMAADDYLPILVYLLLQANPPELQSNVDYIGSFRARSRMTGEAGYFFTHVAGAVYFIETLDASKLSIDPLIFEQLFAEEDENAYAFVLHAGQPSVPSLSHDASPSPSPSHAASPAAHTPHPAPSLASASPSAAQTHAPASSPAPAARTPKAAEAPREDRGGGGAWAEQAGAEKEAPGKQGGGQGRGGGGRGGREESPGGNASTFLQFSERTGLFQGSYGAVPMSRHDALRAAAAKGKQAVATGSEGQGEGAAADTGGAGPVEGAGKGKEGGGVAKEEEEERERRGGAGSEVAEPGGAAGGGGKGQVEEVTPEVGGRVEWFLEGYGSSARGSGRQSGSHVPEEGTLVYRGAVSEGSPVSAKEGGWAVVADTRSVPDPEREVDYVPPGGTGEYTIRKAKKTPILVTTALGGDPWDTPPSQPPRHPLDPGDGGAGHWLSLPSVSPGAASARPTQGGGGGGRGAGRKQQTVVAEGVAVRGGNPGARPAAGAAVGGVAAARQGNFVGFCEGGASVQSARARAVEGILVSAEHPVESGQGPGGQKAKRRTLSEFGLLEGQDDTDGSFLAKNEDSGLDWLTR